MRRPFVCEVCGETAMSGDRGRLPTRCRVCRTADDRRRYREAWYPKFKAGPKYPAWRERVNAIRDRLRTPS